VRSPHALKKQGSRATSPNDTRTAAHWYKYRKSMLRCSKLRQAAISDTRTQNRSPLPHRVAWARSNRGLCFELAACDTACVHANALCRCRTFQPSYNTGAGRRAASSFIIWHRQTCARAIPPGRHLAPREHATKRRQQEAVAATAWPRDRMAASRSLGQPVILGEWLDHYPSVFCP